jgi:pilus assembly protein CpaB
MSGLLVMRFGRAWAALRRYHVAWALLGSLCFGAIAAFGARNYIHERLDQERQRLQPVASTIEVVVASRALKAGETVGPETMALRAVPIGFAPARAVTPERFEAIVGARLVVDMNAGEPLLTSAFEAPDDASIAMRVRPGIRAMTIAVDEVNALSGMLQPGDRIDLLWSVRPPEALGAASGEVTRMMLQGIRVLATGRQLHTTRKEGAVESPTYTTITVEVDPEQAQKLVIAQRSGSLTAVLRHPEDRGPAIVPERDLHRVLGLKQIVSAVSVPSAPELIVGGKGPLTSASNVSASLPNANTPAFSHPPSPGSSVTEPEPEAPGRISFEAALERLLNGSRP